MNKEKYNQIFDDAYKNWKSKGRDFIEEQIDGMFTSELGEKEVDRILKQWFITKIKTDPEFSKKCGLKIEERELSLEDRAKWLQNNKGYDLLVGNLDHDHIRDLVEDEAPIKLISLTYNNETIKIYDYE